MHILLPCGYDNSVKRQRVGFSGRKGCGAWCGYDTPEPYGHPFRPLRPRIYKGVCYCPECWKLAHTTHMGQGVLMRPRFEDD